MPASALRVLVTTTSFQDVAGPHQSLLSAAGYEVTGVRGPLSELQLAQLMGEFDGLLCGDDDVSRTVIERAVPRLKAISKYGVGLDGIDLRAARDHGVQVAYCPGVNRVAVAEHVFALILSIFRNIPGAAASMRRGEWLRDPGRELHGKRLGIVGLGNVGKEVASRARAFGMPVLAYGRSWDPAFAGHIDVARVLTLDRMLAEADIVSLHVPLAPSTRHLINRERLEQMQPGSVLINTARGALVDTEAVVDALESGHLRAYGADVYEIEPLPADAPLRRCAGAILTAHVASRTHETVLRQAAMAADNLVRMLQGRPAIFPAPAPG